MQKWNSPQVGQVHYTNASVWASHDRGLSAADSFNSFSFYPPHVSMEGYILFVTIFSLSGYRYLGNGGTDRREILHDGACMMSVPNRSSRLLPFWGGTARASKSEILGLNLYLENGKSQRCI